MNAAATSISLREAHKALTRTRIVDAALALMEAGDEHALTLAHVAETAGVTERTLYRHFETRDALLAAVWSRVNESMADMANADTPRELVAQPRRLFAAFDEKPELIRAIVHTRQGRDLRLASNAKRRARFRSVVRAARPDLEEPAVTRLAAVVQLLDSAYAWAAMREYWDLDGTASGEAASDAIEILLRAPEAKERPR
jgi:AcrR family transcriptional regulator